MTDHRVMLDLQSINTEKSNCWSPTILQSVKYRVGITIVI